MADRSRDARRTGEEIACRYQTGIAWRDLPVTFGPWQTNITRHTGSGVELHETDHGPAGKAALGASQPRRISRSETAPTSISSQHSVDQIGSVRGYRGISVALASQLWPNKTVSRAICLGDSTWVGCVRKQYHFWLADARFDACDVEAR